jgi:hypothetical protein
VCVHAARVRACVRVRERVCAPPRSLDADRDRCVAALTAPPTAYWPVFQAAAVSLLRRLYDRHAARPLAPPPEGEAMWVIDGGAVDAGGLVAAAFEGGAAEGGGGGGGGDFVRLVRAMPFVVPFAARAAAFGRVRLRDRGERQVCVCARACARVRVFCMSVTVICVRVRARLWVRAGGGAYAYGFLSCGMLWNRLCTFRCSCVWAPVVMSAFSRRTHGERAGAEWLPTSRGRTARGH